MHGGQPNEPGQARGRILLIDDDLALGSYLARVLRTHGGFEVTHELDAATALRDLEAERWDLLITDIEMPGMTGLELASRARRITPALPILMITGHATVDRAVTALRNAVDEFLHKPVAAEDLIGRATALVEAARKAHAATSQSVLAVGAHPGDVEIGAGGTLLAHRASGDTVALLALSRGPRDDEDRRARESRRAADVVGARLFLEDLEYGQIPEGDPAIGIIEQAIATVQPTIVYAHTVNDFHSDHRNVHRAVMVAARRVGQVYCYQSHSATIDFRPTHFVGIDRHVGAKLSTLAIFGSRAERDALEPDVVESTARYWSRFGGSSHAEAFEVVRNRATRPDEVQGARLRTGR